jgi:hypothetical protein
VCCRAGIGAAAAGLGDLAGFDRHHVGGVRADRQGCADPGDHVGVVHVPVQQQHPGQHAGRGELARQRGGPLTTAPRGRR